jgi:alpha-L-fucosidase
LYAIILAWPENGTVTIKSLATDSGLFQREIEKVELLGFKEPLRWTRDRSGLTIGMPAYKPCDYAFALQIKSG